MVVVFFNGRGGWMSGGMTWRQEFGVWTDFSFANDFLLSSYMFYFMNVQIKILNTFWRFV